MASSMRIASRIINEDRISLWELEEGGADLAIGQQCILGDVKRVHTTAMQVLNPGARL